MCFFVLSVLVNYTCDWGPITFVPSEEYSLGTEFIGFVRYLLGKKIIECCTYVVSM